MVVVLTIPLPEGHLKAAFATELTSNYFNDVKELEETVEKDAAAAGAHCTSSNRSDVATADARQTQRPSSPNFDLFLVTSTQHHQESGRKSTK